MVPPNGRMMRRATNVFLLCPILVVLFVGCVVPVLTLVLISLRLPLRTLLDASGLSWGSYARLVTDGYYASLLLRTYAVALIVATVATALAYPVAIYLSRTSSMVAPILSAIVFTPIVVGMNMLTLGWMIILGRTGFLNTLLTEGGLTDRPLDLLYNSGAVVVGMTHVALPFVVLPIEAVLRKVDPAIGRAARIHGAGPMRAFFHVTLPLSLDGAAAGFLIVFLQVCGAFVLPLLLGGQSFATVPVAIWEQITVSADRPFAAALSMALILTSVLVLVLQLRFTRTRAAL